MFEYRCTCFIPVHRTIYNITIRNGMEEEMKLEHKCQTCGSLALNSRHTTHLVVIEGTRSKPKQRPGAMRRPSRVGRNVVGLLVCSVATIVALFASAYIETSHRNQVSDRLDAMPKVEVSVVTGDTMWRIAEEYEVEGVSTAELIAWMRTNNNMESPCLEPGQQLLVPHSS